MSWKASGYVKEVIGITRSEKLLLLLLGDYYDESRGWAWPGVERLAAEGMLSVRHTIRLLQSLERKGVIEISRTEGVVNRYRFPGYSTPDTVSPVTSNVMGTRDIQMSHEPTIEPSGSVVNQSSQARSGRGVYKDLVDLTNTLPGVRTQKYWDSDDGEWVKNMDTELVMTAVNWVGMAMGVTGAMTLPTPTFLPALSRLGEYVDRQKVRPDSTAVLTVVKDGDRVREKILYGVARHVGPLIGELQ